MRVIRAAVIDVIPEEMLAEYHFDHHFAMH
jgi:hypothetical protein